MKTLLFLFATFLAMIHVKAQSTEYMAETTEIDKFVLVTGNQERTIISTRSDNTQFIFTTDKPEETLIKMTCTKCENGISLALFRKKDNTYTETIELKNNQEISIAECFSKYAKPKGWRAFISSSWQALKDFWYISDTERIPPRRTPAMKGPNMATEEEDPKMEILTRDFSHFLEEKDFTMEAKYFKDYPIKRIYILNHETGDLVFLAGSKKIFEDLYDLTGKSIPDLNSVITPSPGEEDNIRQITVTWENISSYLLEPLKKGELYQLGITLDKDNSSHNSYLFNFQFFTEEQLDELKRFFIRE